MKIELSSDERRHLKALAHPLNPVVMIGNNGLTDAVMREIAINLDAHELIKIRVQGDDREVRVALLEQICQDLSAAPVQHIGKLLVIYRPTGDAKITLPKKQGGSAQRLALQTSADPDRLERAALPPRCIPASARCAPLRPIGREHRECSRYGCSA